MNEYRRYVPETGWTVVVRTLPYRLGYLSRVESGPYYRAVAAYAGLTWWWRPTYTAAHRRAFREAFEAPNRAKGLGS